jgi:hypothetical protein
MGPRGRGRGRGHAMDMHVMGLEPSADEAAISKVVGYYVCHLRAIVLSSLFIC